VRRVLATLLVASTLGCLPDLEEPCSGGDCGSGADASILEIAIDVGSIEDASSPDAFLDANVADEGPSDLGFMDAIAPDVIDVPDVGPPDTGPPDTGLEDAGAIGPWASELHELQRPDLEPKAVAATSRRVIVAGGFDEEIDLEGVRRTPVARDSFIIAYDNDGTVAWRVHLTGNGNQVVSALAAAGDQVYVGGTCTSELWIGTTPFTCTAAGQSFLFRLNASGTLSSTVALYGVVPSGVTDLVYDAVLDRVYATGSISEPRDLSPCAVARPMNARSPMAYVAGFDGPTGRCVWGRAIASDVAGAVATAVEIDAARRVRVVGTVPGALLAVNAQGGTRLVPANGPAPQAFLLGYDADNFGALIGASVDVIRAAQMEPNDLAFEPNDRGLFIAGKFGTSAMFSTLTSSVVLASGELAVGLRFESDGTFRAVKAVNAMQGTLATLSVAPTAGGVVFAGRLSPSADMVFGGIFLINRTTAGDAVLLHTNTQGTGLGANNFAGSGEDVAVGVATYARLDAITAAGYYEGTITLAPETLTSTSGRSAWVYRIP
jgi:hypothetical protein